MLRGGLQLHIFLLSLSLSLSLSLYIYIYSQPQKNGKKIVRPFPGEVVCISFFIFAQNIYRLQFIEKKKKIFRIFLNLNKVHRIEL